jgi:hypothetical protein
MMRGNERPDRSHTGIEGSCRCRLHPARTIYRCPATATAFADLLMALFFI